MAEEIFITSYDQRMNRTLVLESNDHSLWAYLVFPDTNKIEIDGFVCSLVEPDEFVQLPIEKGMPPPLIKQYSNVSSFVRDLKKEQLNIVWSGNVVKVLIDENVYLEINTVTKTSRSKSISKPGPYGRPLY